MVPANNTRLKVVLINHSDIRGGASVVSMRLLKALGASGIDARMIVREKSTDSLRVDAVTPRWRAKACFLAEHADIYVRNGFNRDNVFKISTARFGMPLHRHPWVREADVVCLNWINQGLLSLRGIERIHRLGKPVVWTMHDQWNMTGVCHYTSGCERWKETCGNCPLVREGRSLRDLSTTVQARKSAFYSRVPVSFVAVSNRLAELARQSSLMSDADITVIPNAFPVDRYTCEPDCGRELLGLPTDGRLVVMGAARLDDPVKNFPLAIEALNHVTTPGAVAVLFGDLRNPSLLDRLTIPHVWLGRIDGDRVRSLMAHADVVLSTSVWETLPGTLIEGIASGAVAVATTNGGQADIISDGFNGYLVSENGAEVIAGAIDKAFGLDFGIAGRESRHTDMAARFSARAVAERYAELFGRLIKR